jgi:hypothetical protein
MAAIVCRNKRTATTTNAKIKDKYLQYNMQTDCSFHPSITKGSGFKGKNVCRRPAGPLAQRLVAKWGVYKYRNKLN